MHILWVLRYFEVFVSDKEHCIIGRDLVWVVLEQVQKSQSLHLSDEGVAEHRMVVEVQSEYDRNEKALQIS